MILKLISISELDFATSWRVGLSKIKDLSRFDKYMTIFWLLGPFIYLIERDPADLWLTSICLIFLFKSFKSKNWEWSSQLWFKLALLLWIFGRRRNISEARNILPKWVIQKAALAADLIRA